MVEYKARLGLYIGGEWLTAAGRQTHAVVNPATGETIGDLPLANIPDLDRALDAASRGFNQWRVVPGDERAATLMKVATLLRERVDHLAAIITLEQGKIQAEARLEILFAAKLLEFHAGEAMRIYGRVLPRPAGSRSLVIQQPVGVVAAFCAWNFPVMNVVRKIAPAVAAGCSVIIKPSEEAAGSAVETIRCFQDAGLPGEVVQCVFGVPDMVSRHLLASPVTRKLSFTGSVPVGKHLSKLAAETMMKTTMELGGHGPVLVFDDCDLDKTLDMLVGHKFRNAGQVCIAPTRFYVQEGIYDRFAAGFVERTKRLKVGNGFDRDVQMGPLANPRRPQSIDAMIEDARAAGAKLLSGGARPDKAGFFYEPTILGEVPQEAVAMNEEPFGPLALLRPFSTVDEAIEQANRLPFGLAAYCFTNDGRRQNLLGDTVEAGMVAINSVRLSWPDSPFGGMKDSGHGSEDGPEGVAAHLVSKTIHIE